jgi:DNA-binding beta-propeller fold protein YncE
MVGHWRGPLAMVTALLMLAAVLAARSGPPVQAIQTDPQPTNRSTPIAYAAPYLVVANPDSNSVTVFHLPSGEKLYEAATGREPAAVAVDAARGRFYVAHKGSATLTAVALATGQPLATVPTGDRPVALVLTADGRFLIVAVMGEDLVRFLDAGTLETVRVQGVADRPFSLALTPDGRYLLVTHLLDGRVTVLAADPYRVYLPLGAGQDAGPGSSGTAAAPPAQIETWPHIAPAPGITISKNGRRAYLPQTMANGQGLNTQFDATLFPKVSVLNLETWQHQSAEHISLPETDRPVGLPWAAALAADGAELWLVNAASNDVSVVDLSDPRHPRRRGHVPVGANPRGIALNEDASLAYVSNSLDGTVSIIDTAVLTVTGVITTTSIPLPPLLLRGKQLFHSSADPALARAGWISCNSCHIEGEHDGRTWQILFTGDQPDAGDKSVLATVPRNTTGLLGMIETYPLRWSAEWDESADSEFSIRFEQFGDGLIAGDMHHTSGTPNQGRSAALDSLAAYIDSLMIPDGKRPFNAAARRGQRLFDSPQTACRDCHPPPLYTDLQQHDVGTAGGPDERFGPLIDTPTLRFLYDSAPYLHDGSAATLYELLTIKNTRDAHGVTSRLSESELQDLIAYLRCLPHDE